MRKRYIIAIVIEVIVLSLLLVLCAILGKIDKDHSGDDTIGEIQTTSQADNGLGEDPFTSVGSTTGTPNDTSTPTTVPGTSIPNATSKPSQSTEPPVATKPTESTKPVESKPVVSTPPTESIKPSEGTGKMTYEQYINMSSTEQKAYRDTFETVTAFFEWYNNAKAEYDAQKPNVDVGDGPIDLGGNGNG